MSETTTFDRLNPLAWYVELADWSGNHAVAFSLWDLADTFEEAVEIRRASAFDPRNGRTFIRELTKEEWEVHPDRTGG